MPAGSEGEMKRGVPVPVAPVGGVSAGEKGLQFLDVPGGRSHRQGTAGVGAGCRPCPARHRPSLVPVRALRHPRISVTRTVPSLSNPEGSMESGRWDVKTVRSYYVINMSIDPVPRAGIVPLSAGMRGPGALLPTPPRRRPKPPISGGDVRRRGIVFGPSRSHRNGGAPVRTQAVRRGRREGAASRCRERLRTDGELPARLRRSRPRCLQAVPYAPTYVGRCRAGLPQGRQGRRFVPFRETPAVRIRQYAVMLVSRCRHAVRTRTNRRSGVWTSPEGPARPDRGGDGVGGRNRRQGSSRRNRCAKRKRSAGRRQVPREDGPPESVRHPRRPPDTPRCARGTQD